MSRHPVLQQHIDALTADGCTVHVLDEIDIESLPDVLATKNARNVPLRLVPREGASDVGPGGDFPLLDSERQWDGWWKGGGGRFANIQDAIDLINSAPVPEEPVEQEPEEPPPPSPTHEYIRVWGSPQTNRPRQRISPTNYGLCSGQNNEDTYGQFVTYERIAAVGTQDRIQVVKETGQDLVSMRFGPKPGDLQNNGCRASLSATWQDDFNRFKKVSFAYQGDRTLDKFKVKFPTAGMPDVSRPSGSGYFGLFFQWHQQANTGGSPPVEFNFRQHGTTGVYWIWARLKSIEFDSQGLFPIIGQTGNGVVWTEPMQLDHWYQFEVEIYHSTVDAGQTDPRRGGPGSIRIKVDGVDVLATTAMKTMADIYNFVDCALYQGRCINANRYLFFNNWEHYVVPGAPIPNVAGQPNITTNPLYSIYTPP